MKPQSQARKKDPWAWLKKIIRKLNQPLSFKQLFLLIMGIIIIFSFTTFINISTKQMAEEKRRKQLLATQKKAEKERQKTQQHINIPHNPYSFYEKLEERSFYILGEEEHGGMEAKEKLQTPKFYLISQSIDSEESLEIDLARNDVIKEDSNSITHKENRETLRNYKKLQTGSFISLNEANVQRKHLESYGYSPHILQAKRGEQTIYRVQLGPFAHNELELIKQDLKKKKFDFFEIKNN